MFLEGDNRSEVESKWYGICLILLFLSVFFYLLVLLFFSLSFLISSLFILLTLRIFPSHIFAHLSSAFILPSSLILHIFPSLHITLSLSYPTFFSPPHLVSLCTQTFDLLLLFMSLFVLFLLLPFMFSP